MMNMLFGANADADADADADANDWVTTLALLDFVRRAKNQFTGTATQPQRNRKFCQFNKDQYCMVKRPRNNDPTRKNIAPRSL